MKTTQNQPQNENRMCDFCGGSLTGRQTKFCSGTCKNRVHQCYEAQRERGHRRKRQLVDQMGGSCEICGYSKNIAALVFHHTDPSTKSFQIDVRSCSNHSLEVLYEEAQKCKLVCMNCHSEIHYPHFNT